jgi:hypothetical protein
MLEKMARIIHDADVGSQAPERYAGADTASSDSTTAT